MKLIQKTNRNFFVIISVALPISCALLYFSLNFFISDEVDEKLNVDLLRIEEQLGDIAYFPQLKAFKI